MLLIHTPGTGLPHDRLPTRADKQRPITAQPAGGDEPSRLTADLSRIRHDRSKVWTGRSWFLLSADACRRS
ncbi:hypothetical protein [Actinoplanes auranticolor]|uniref:Uncharacterized protein n=1 Tax=Actinoplanes auranticolor TaxID=47988 RepID=A0A919VXL3_9ACTN|nr:hypothetical protein [Actinoplanes auranticolor]GIM80816.1 hypothetical protein Aau02nite_92180 [Actinoplanes auranticolor]